MPYILYVLYVCYYSNNNNVFVLHFLIINSLQNALHKCKIKPGSLQVNERTLKMWILKKMDE